MIGCSKSLGAANGEPGIFITSFTDTSTLSSSYQLAEPLDACRRSRVVLDINQLTPSLLFKSADICGFLVFLPLTPFVLAEMAYEDPDTRDADLLTGR